MPHIIIHVCTGLNIVPITFTFIFVFSSKEYCEVGEVIFSYKNEETEAQRLGSLSDVMQLVNG